MVRVFGPNRVVLFFRFQLQRFRVIKCLCDSSVSSMIAPEEQAWNAVFATW
jgi:hypothetical protein